MANFKDLIEDFVAGNDLEINRIITDIPTGSSIVKAWLTIKQTENGLDVDALVQKVITTVNISGVGQITDDGAADEIGAVRFDLLPVDTALLITDYKFFDIQLYTSTGKTYTPIKGRIMAKKQITKAVGP